MAKPYDSIRIFQSPFLERFTHVHPITPLVFWTPIIALLFYRSIAIHEVALVTMLWLAAVAAVTWTLTEYLLHRFVFHFPAKSRAGQFLVFLFHGLHHDDPIDPTRLVMPPIASVIIAIPVYSFYRMIFGPVLVEPFFAFFVIGYLAYDYIHYAVHHFTPRTRVGKFLKHNHMQHHFVAHGALWGVSSPLWDHVFGTVYKTPKKKAASKPRAPSAAQV